MSDPRPRNATTSPSRGPSGLRKAAILLVTLPAETSALVFQSLSEDDMERISQEIAHLGPVDRQETVEVLEEFKDTATVQQMLREGGFDNAIELIRSSLPEEKANRLVRLLNAQRQSMPFYFLEHTEADVMVTFPQEEHPQTIALILSYMPPSNAAEVLTGFPPERQVEIVRRIATLGHTSPEAIKRVEAGLQKFLATQAFEERQEVGGVKTVSEILNVLDRSTERAILETIEEDDNELAEDIKKLMFVFDDLVLVDDRGMQNVLREIANEVLALALKTASDELKEKIFRNMSVRAAETVQSEIEFMGPVRITDVEAAQSQVVEVVRRLEEAGDVVISGRGGETDLVE